jgi:hypothetical protein
MNAPMTQRVNRFDFGDLVRIKDGAPSPLRRGQIASVFMVFLPEDRWGSYMEQFPPGVLYSVEYEDGDAVQVHEDFLEFAEPA